jgi:uncharacterized protein
MAKTAIRLLASISFVYAVICIFMWGYQRELIYHPVPDQRPPAEHGLADFAEIKKPSNNNVTISLWYHAAEPNQPTVIYFHGNAGNLGSRTHFFQRLADVGLGVLALSYRGYGASEGSPSEQGIYADARVTMRHALETLKLPSPRLLLYGESLGSGVAVQMATEFEVGGVMLQSPYTSISAIGQGQYPWLPVDWLLEDRFDSIGKIKRVNAPLLIIHGEQDPVVPVEHGRALFAAAKEPKVAVFLPDIGHGGFNQAMLVERVITFPLKD